MMYESADLVMVTKEEYARMIRAEEKLATLKRLFESGIYIDEGMLRVLFEIEAAAENN